MKREFPYRRLLSISLAIFLGWSAWNALEKADYFGLVTFGVAAILLLTPWIDRRPRPLSDPDLVEHLTPAERDQYNELFGRPALIALLTMMGSLIAGQVAEELLGRPWFHVGFFGGVIVYWILMFRAAKPVKVFLRSTEYARAHQAESVQSQATP